MRVSGSVSPDLLKHPEKSVVGQFEKVTLQSVPCFPDQLAVLSEIFREILVQGYTCAYSSIAAVKKRQSV